jgi:hypothetical protein
MANLAKRHATADIIYAADAPRLDMRGIHNRMPLRCDQPDTAERAPMIIEPTPGR